MHEDFALARWPMELVQVVNDGTNSDMPPYNSLAWSLWWTDNQQEDSTKNNHVPSSRKRSRPSSSSVYPPEPTAFTKQPNNHQNQRESAENGAKLQVKIDARSTVEPLETSPGVFVSLYQHPYKATDYLLISYHAAACTSSSIQGHHNQPNRMKMILRLSNCRGYGITHQLCGGLGAFPQVLLFCATSQPATEPSQHNNNTNDWQSQFDASLVTDGVLVFCDAVQQPTLSSLSLTDWQNMQTEFAISKTFANTHDICPDTDTLLVHLSLSHTVMTSLPSAKHAEEPVRGTAQAENDGDRTGPTTTSSYWKSTLQAALTRQLQYQHECIAAHEDRLRQQDYLRRQHEHVQQQLAVELANIPIQLVRLSYQTQPRNTAPHSASHEMVKPKIQSCLILFEMAFFPCRRSDPISTRHEHQQGPEKAAQDLRIGLSMSSKSQWERIRSVSGIIDLLETDSVSTIMVYSEIDSLDTHETITENDIELIATCFWTSTDTRTSNKGPQDMQEVLGRITIPWNHLVTPLDHVILYQETPSIVLQKSVYECRPPCILNATWTTEESSQSFTKLGLSKILNQHLRPHLSQVDIKAENSTKWIIVLYPSPDSSRELLVQEIRQCLPDCLSVDYPVIKS